MGGRGSSNASGGGGKISISSATRTLKADAQDFANGNAPRTITVKGIKMTGGETGSYQSGGGFTVRTYKYSAENQINADGSDSITFNATAYKTRNGTKASGYERRKPRVFNVKITGRSAYSTGRSGGI